jgi:hypothetical protein
MAENWAADVKKYVSDANEEAVPGIVKYCGIALKKKGFLVSLLHRPGGGCAGTQ